MHPLPPRLLLVALVAAVCAPATWAQPAVWTEVEAPPASVRLHPEAGTERPGGRAPDPHYVRLDRAALSAAVAEARRGDSPSLSFEVVPGVHVQSTAVWTEQRGPDRLTWSGSVEGDPLGHVLLTVEGAAAVGHIATGGRSYSVGYAGGGRQVVYEVDPAALGVPCHVVEGGNEEGLFEGPERPSGWRQEKSASATDTVRVMLLYTAAVREAVGEAGVAALLQGSIDSANDVFIRSEVAGRVAAAHAREVPTLGPDLAEDALDALTYLWRWWDGVLDEIHAWRWEHGAHLVSLFTELPGYCGAARVPLRLERDFVLINGFSVVQRSCAIANRSFAHEVGHNLGLLHDPYVNQGSGPFSFGHGYVSLAGAPGEQFRTVMAYEVECAESGSECPRVPYFSNASLMLGRHPLGEPGLSDAARALSISVPLVTGLEMNVDLAPDLYLSTWEDAPVAFVPSLDVIGIRISVPPRHGDVEVSGNAELVYRPDANYFGADSLAYEGRGRYGNWISGEVLLEIEPLQDPPYTSEIIAPPDGVFIDLNTMEAPLEVRWTEMGHPDFPEGGAPLEATWRFRAGQPSQSGYQTFSIRPEDSTHLEVPVATLDEMMASENVPPGAQKRVFHWITVFDGVVFQSGYFRSLYVRRLEQADEAADDDGEAEEPLVPTLRAAYPNPTRETLTLEVGVPDAGKVHVTIYDVVGRPVRTVERALEAGFNRVRLDLRPLPAGVYFYRVEAGDETFRGRVTVL